MNTYIVLTRFSDTFSEEIKIKADYFSIFDGQLDFVINHKIPHATIASFAKGFWSRVIKEVE